MPVAEKSLRSDARRNHELLIASARELFATAGVDVSVEEITQHAGVGMGTLYRHFRTKDELVDAVLEGAFSDVVRLAEEGARADDAWAGFTTFVERVLELHAKHPGVKDLLATRANRAGRADAMRARIGPLLARMVERAQAQGALRADFRPADVPVLFWSGGRVIERTADIAPDAWRRHLAFLLDGLRAPGATRLAVKPLTRAQLSRVHRQIK